MKNYEDFFHELENNFLYEMFHVPFYKDIKDLPSHLHLRPDKSIELGRHICSIFSIDYARCFYKEGKLLGWTDPIILLWTAYKLMDRFIEDYMDGLIPDDLITVDSVYTIRDLSFEYQNLFDETLLDYRNKLCYNSRVIVK